jgi:hypothetical protein
VSAGEEMADRWWSASQGSRGSRGSKADGSFSVTARICYLCAGGVSAVNLSGWDGSDAKPYQEDAVREVLQRAKEAERKGHP